MDDAVELKLEPATVSAKLRLALVYATLFAVALYPVFAVEIPPLVDYPNHLARMHILASIDDIPALRANYTVGWRPSPNLAMEAVVPLLARFMPILEAGRLFVAATLLVLAGGTLALSRVLHGRLGLWPAAVFLFLYNFAFAWGFLNYLFTAGLALLAFAAWIATNRWPRTPRLAMFSVISLALYFGHLFALGFFGLLIAAYELGQVLEAPQRSPMERIRAWALSLVPFAAPVALWLTLTESAPGAPINIYGGLEHKLIALLSPTMFHGELSDLAIFLFVWLVLVRGAFSGALRLEPTMRLPLLAVGLASVLMPNWLFSIWGMDFRLPPLLVYLVVAATQFEPKRVVTARAVALTGFILFMFQTFSIATAWQAYDRRFAEFRAASAKIEEGASLLAMQERVTDIPHGDTTFGQVYWQTAALSVIDRSAFVPFLFTGFGSVRPAPARAAIDVISGHPLLPEQLREGADPARSGALAGRSLRGWYRVYWANWPANFDYLVVWLPTSPTNPFPGRLSLLHRGTFFDLYRVIR